MKLSLLPVLAFICLLPSAEAVLLFSDNFNAPDTNNLDTSSQAGRRSGMNPNIQVRSSRIQHGIVGNQLDFLNINTGRIRFHDDADNNTATEGAKYDWATGAIGSRILADGGLRIEFDWLAGNNTSTNWVAANVGFLTDPEPAFRVNSAGTDAGILFRFNGGTHVFDNGADLGQGSSFPALVGSRKIKIDYLFSSFADGATVTINAMVNGISVYRSNAFTWNGNANSMILELETLENTRIDNLMISSIPEPSISFFTATGLVALLLVRRRCRA